MFLFPFYYMLIGSLQTEPDTTPAGALPNPGNLTVGNYADIDARLDLGTALLNSGIFTGGVLLCTVVFGVLAGYALARLHFRGRALLFNLMLLVQVIPFQLLTIPLYVLIVRTYGLADTYLGMILPFAINSAAVFVFRQYFLQLPRELFEAAQIDGASELTILWRVALPLVKPALLTAVLLTFIGPWNEFLWPFLITKQADMQPLAVALANYMSNVAARAANPFGALLAGRVRAGRAGDRAVRRLPAPLRRHQPRIQCEGLISLTPPYTLTRVGVLMTPEPGNELEAEGVLNPASGFGPDGRLYLLPRLVAAGNVSRVGLAEVDADRRRADRGVPARRRARTGRGLGTRHEQRRRRGPAGHLDPAARRARDDLRRLRPARARSWRWRCRRTSPSGGGSGRSTSATSRGWTPT